MANKGFFHLFFSALTVALLSFFILYFFAPSISTKFLGVSFDTRKGSANALMMTSVENAVGDAVEHMKNSPEFTKESLDKLQDLLNSAEVQAKLKAAAKKGEDVLKDAVKTVTDKVK